MASIKDLKRMCKYYTGSCKGCPLYCHSMCQVTYPNDFPSNADELVDKWIKEHPEKTYLQDFLEKIPNAKLKDNGVPCACRNNIYDDVHNCDKNTCTDCWNKPIEKEK